jgi:hypothetical protein
MIGGTKTGLPWIVGRKAGFLRKSLPVRVAIARALKMTDRRLGRGRPLDGLNRTSRNEKDQRDQHTRSHPTPSNACRQALRHQNHVRIVFSADHHGHKFASNSQPINKSKQ